jgi:hypothetical protein
MINIQIQQCLFVNYFVISRLHDFVVIFLQEIKPPIIFDLSILQ